jgi:phosphatidylglycerophosphate synthase
MALLCMRHHPIYCTITYCVSCLLDAVDGYAARALNQTSKFGAVLDMVIDRCVPSCLYAIFKFQRRVQMHDVLSLVLSVLGLSRLRAVLSVLNYPRF